MSPITQGSCFSLKVSGDTASISLTSAHLYCSAVFVIGLLLHLIYKLNFPSGVSVNTCTIFGV